MSHSMTAITVWTVFQFQKLIIHKVTMITKYWNSRTFKDLLHQILKNFKALFCFQVLSRSWKNGLFFQGLSGKCGHPENRPEQAKKTARLCLKVNKAGTNNLGRHTGVARCWTYSRATDQTWRQFVVCRVSLCRQAGQDDAPASQLSEHT